jgi:hypothetical protein
MKTQLLLISFIALCFAATAQSNSYINPPSKSFAKSLVQPAAAALKPGFGVRAGVLSSGLTGDAGKNLESILAFTDGMFTTSDRTGFFGGVYASIPLSTNLVFEPGVNYSQKGYQLNGQLDVKSLEFLGVNAKSVLDMQYIDIPVLLKANFDGLQIFAGPQLSYLSMAQLKTTAGALGFNFINNTLDATSQFNKWDAAITGGIGYQFTNGLNIMASYDHGINKIDAGKNMNAYNRSYKIGIGMRF